MSYKIQVIGLEGSGKTTLAKVMALGDLDAEDLGSYTINHNGLAIELNEDATTADLILFCLDGSNLQQLPANKSLIAKVTDKMIIVQTKSDIQTIDAHELREFLGINEQIPIVSVSAATNDGIEEAIELLAQAVQEQPTPNQAAQSFEFEAEPRVVASRGKYKANQPLQVSKPQQTFNNLMKDKKIKQLTPMQQEQEYIRLEKERIKMENMAAQLNNFKKKIKKEETYDIKATANPRIQVNLEFFLTDTLNTLETQVTTLSTQTDTLLKKPESPRFVPKKTGIDAATQVEDYELFDFDREVSPILDVICTKTLEQASLEIEQEEEFKAMYQFKEAFKLKREQEKQKQQDVVKHEKQLVDQKNEVLRKYSEKQERIKKMVYKAEGMRIAQHYIKKLPQQVIQDVVDSGFYQNNFNNELNTKFVDWLVQKTQCEVNKIVEIKTEMRKAFNNQFDQIPKARQPADQFVNKKKLRTQKRMINYSEQRAVRIQYTDTTPVLTILAMTLNKFIDGTYDEWRKTYDNALNELEQKLEANEFNEEEYCNRKRVEYPDIPENYYSLSVNNFQRLAFSMAHDQYYKVSDQRLQPCAIIINRDGSYEILDYLNPRIGDKIMKLKQNFRLNLKQTDDQAIIIRLQELNDDVVTIIFGLMLPNLQNNTKALEWIQNARFGLYDAEYCIPFAQTSIPKSYKLEELVKVPEDPDQGEAPQTSFLSCFVLTKRYKQFGGWYIENSITATKGMLNQEIDPFFQKLSQFVIDHYDLSLERDKDILQILLEKEKDKDTALTQQEITNIITRSRIPLPRKMATQTDSNDSPPPSGRVNLNEPVDTPKELMYSQTIDTLILNLGLEFQEYEDIILRHLSSQAPNLIGFCQHGFELKVRGQSFLRAKQLIRVREIGQFTIHRKAEIPPPKEEIQLKEGGDDNEQQNEDDS